MVETDKGLILRSENRDHPELEVTTEDVLIATQVGVFRPEDLAPPPGTRLSEEEIAEGFGVSESPGPGASRVDGHLFLRIDGEGGLLPMNQTDPEAGIFCGICQPCSCPCGSDARVSGRGG